MAIQERTNIKIDLARIQERDLADAPHARSGWHLRMDEKNSTNEYYQMLVRPDNFPAMDYLQGLGYEVGTKLIDNGRRFLLPVNLFKPTSLPVVNPFIDSLEQLLKTF